MATNAALGVSADVAAMLGADMGLPSLASSDDH
jgi:hypothetical protein